jgi:hypothetical protein
MISLFPTFYYDIQNSLASKGGFYIDWNKTYIVPNEIKADNFDIIIQEFINQEILLERLPNPITKEIFESQEFRTYSTILKETGLKGIYSVKIVNAGLPNPDTNDFDILCNFYGDLLAIEIKNKGTITDVDKQIKRGRALFLPIYFYFYDGEKLKTDFDAYLSTPDLSEVTNYGKYKKWTKGDLSIYNIERLYFLDHSKDLKQQFDLAMRINNKFKLGYTSCLIENDADFAEKYGFEVEILKPENQKF